MRKVKSEHVYAATQKSRQKLLVIPLCDLSRSSCIFATRGEGGVLWMWRTVDGAAPASAVARLDCRQLRPQIRPGSYPSRPRRWFPRLFLIAHRFIRLLLTLAPQGPRRRAQVHQHSPPCTSVDLSLTRTSAQSPLCRPLFAPRV